MALSEEAGVRKPDPAIFELAAARCGATLVGGWMVGDHPAYDIAGGNAAGLRTILVGDHHCDENAAVATCRVRSVVEAFRVIVAG
ncbi:HAD family hydrolase [Kribbella monticola]|uniref:HAD family hydrolase n=1 Tax=Kribbella monticola TaxID=2185285 RepID=UPI001E444CE4|nr:HAD family hydrolase [Kribbella monticola]